MYGTFSTGKCYSKWFMDDWKADKMVHMKTVKQFETNAHKESKWWKCYLANKMDLKINK